MQIRKRLVGKLIGLLVSSAFLATLAWAQSTVITTTGGTVNSVPKFDNTSSITNSAITENGGQVVVGGVNNYPGGFGSVSTSGSGNGLNFLRRSLVTWPSTPVAGDSFSWYNPDGTARLWTFGNNDLFTMGSGGNASFGPFAIPSTDPGYPVLTGAGSISATGPVAGFYFARRNLGSWPPATPALGDLFAWYNPDGGGAHLWEFGGGDVLTIRNNGELDLGGSLRFPDGSIQTTATLRGPQGSQGPAGPQGPQGPAGPAVHTSAVCGYNPSCPGGFVVSILEGTGGCFVTSDTGNCGLPGGGGRSCSVCRAY